MRKVLGIGFWMLLGGGLVFASFNYHFVRSEEGFVPVPKEHTSLTDCYVDVREWDVQTWQEHDALIRALQKHGRGDLVKQPSTPAGFLRQWLPLRQYQGAEKPDPGVSRE